MTIHPDYIGCDVSKHHLDVFDAATGQSCRLDNTPQAIEAWLAGLGRREAFVVFEATGRYDRRLAGALAARRIPYARVNPARARDFARAIGLIAKTDAVDARMLAALGRCLAPHATPPAEPARQRLAAVLRRRDQLVASRQQEQLRRREAEAGERDSIERHIAWLDGEIAALEAEQVALIRADARLARLEALLRSIPGIGPVTAAVLIALMAELGTLSPKAAAALAGLAPFNVDSGRFRGQRAIRGGRKRVRDALYMAAVTAARTSGRFHAFARDLLDRGKPFKLVMIAVARKLLLTANAVMRDQIPYRA
jgi:transposase